jgi:hypothetical protein
MFLEERSIQMASLSDQVEIIEGAAFDVIPHLAAKINDERREKFGFSFVDGDYENV